MPDEQPSQTPFFVAAIAIGAAMLLVLSLFLPWSEVAVVLPKVVHTFNFKRVERSGWDSFGAWDLIFGLSATATVAACFAFLAQTGSMQARKAAVVTIAAAFICLVGSAGALADPPTPSIKAGAQQSLVHVSSKAAYGPYVGVALSLVMFGAGVALLVHCARRK